jgi:hypothetical protein
VVNEPNETNVKPRRRRTWRRWLFRAGVGLLLTLGVALGWHLYNRHLASEQLRRVVEALDRTDPRWRLHEIEEDRAVIPDEANGALQVLAARAEMPPKWRAPAIDPEWKQVPAPRRLDPKTAEAYRTERDKHPAALERARRMTDFDRGRYSLTITPDVFSTRMPHLEAIREVAWLLATDAVLFAEDGDTSSGLRSCRALFGVASSVGDEPVLISHLVRAALVANACAAAERALAQEQATEEELALFQARVQTEDAQDFHRLVVRADRATLHQFADGVESGAFSLSSATQAKPLPPTWSDSLYEHLLASFLLRAHGRGLELMSEALAVTDLPLPERADGLAPLEAAVRAERSIYAGLFLINPGKHVEAIQRHHAWLRTMQVALAAERYRLKHGVWPVSAEILVPALLERVPDDPYTGAPLRFVWRDGGVIVYCLGADKHDDRGTFDRERPTAPGSDVGVQLWPGTARGQKPRPGSAR